MKCFKGPGLLLFLSAPFWLLSQACEQARPPEEAAIQAHSREPGILRGSDSSSAAGAQVQALDRAPSALEANSGEAGNANLEDLKQASPSAPSDPSALLAPSEPPELAAPSEQSDGSEALDPSAPSALSEPSAPSNAPPHREAAPQTAVSASASDSKAEVATSDAALKHFAEQNSKERQSWVNGGAKIPDLAQRLEYLSRPFLGTPYMVGPLGEGEGRSPAPRLRWDGVDCLTLVETVMAMGRWSEQQTTELPSPAQKAVHIASTASSLSAAPNQKSDANIEADSELLAATPAPAPPAAKDFDETLLPILDTIRYATLPPSYTERNHIAEAQWIPNNTEKGFVADLSYEVAGEQVSVIETHFSPERWDRQRRKNITQLSRDEIPRGTFRLPMLPLDVAQARASKIPSGTLLFVVRRDIESEPTLITHVGLVFDTAQGKVLRHAAQRPYWRVIDEPLDKFLARNARYTQRPVTGVALYRILEAEKPVPVTASIE